jgi:hypothetical protein
MEGIDDLLASSESGIRAAVEPIGFARMDDLTIRRNVPSGLGVGASGTVAFPANPS